MKQLPIPRDLELHSEFIRDIIRQAVQESKVATPSEIDLVKPVSKQFGGAELVGVFLSVSGGATAWLTSKWLDEYLWPILRQHTDRPSHRIIEFLSKHATGTKKTE